MMMTREEFKDIIKPRGVIMQLEHLQRQIQENKVRMHQIVFVG